MPGKRIREADNKLTTDFNEAAASEKDELLVYVELDEGSEDRSLTQKFSEAGRPQKNELTSSETLKREELVSKIKNKRDRHKPDNEREPS